MPKGRRPQEQLPTRGAPVAKVAQKPRKKRRKKNRNLLYILLLLILLIVGTTLSLTVFFMVEEINVIGNDYYSNDDIRGASLLQYNENLFLTSTKGIGEQLETIFPYLEAVKVRKVLPNTINIEVTQASVIASLDLGAEEYALINNSGKILERGLMLLPDEAILVKGFMIEDKQPGEFLGEYSKEKILDEDTESIEEYKQKENERRAAQADYEMESLKVINYLLEAIMETQFQGLTNLDISDRLNMSVMYEGRLLIKFGTEKKLAYKLSYARDAIARLDPRAKGILLLENVSNYGSQGFYRPADGFNTDGAPIGDATITDPLLSVESDETDEVTP